MVMKPVSRLRARLSAGGRVVIPADMRAALGIKEGDAIDLVLEDGSLRIVPSRDVVEKAKKRIKLMVGPRIGVTDVLMEERYAAESKVAGPNSAEVQGRKTDGDGQ